MAMKATVTVFLFLSLFGLNTSLYRKHYYVNEHMGWSDARRYCKTNHDDLSTVSNEELQSLSDNKQITSDYYFIGLSRDPNDPERWSWTEDENATNVVWDQDQPNSPYDQQCGAVRKSIAKVHDVECSWALPFYCMELSKLILVQQQSTWEEALQYCRQNYTDLTSLSLDVIMTQAKDKTTSALTDDVWIGLHFIAGHWFWVNGEDLDYRVWSADEFQCPAMNQRCGVYSVKQKNWKPADCEQRLNFLCVDKGYDRGN